MLTKSAGPNVNVVGVPYSSPLASAGRLALAVVFVMHGTASLLLAQGPQDYIVTFREGTNVLTRAAVVRNAGAALGFNFTRVNAAAVRVPNGNVLTALQNNPSVLTIIPDRPLSAYQSAKGKPVGS